MKIAAAQIASIPGPIDANLAWHLSVARQAAAEGVDALLFPELSLTGYQTATIRALAIQTQDARLASLQTLSDDSGMLIAAGAPLSGPNGVEIALLVFRPNAVLTPYSKRLLHPDEQPFFTPGQTQRIYPCAGQMIAPAICFESLQPTHAREAAEAGATLYMASVAKSAAGMDAAWRHYAEVAQAFGMTVVMANCIGPADDYLGAGGSGIWRADGELLAQAPSQEQFLVIHDSSTGEASVVKLQTRGDA